MIIRVDINGLGRIGRAILKLGDLVKIMSWYDNEWGYANQVIREALALAGRR